MQIIFFSYFLKFSYCYLQNLIKKYKISDGFLKVYYLLKRLIPRLIKWGKSYRSYKINSITAALYIFFISQLIKWTIISKIIKFLMDLDCTTQNVSTSRLLMTKRQVILLFFPNIYFSLRKHWPTSGGSSSGLSDIFSNKQSRCIEVCENVCAKSSFERIYLWKL